jgi:hypothetical protein
MPALREVPLANKHWHDSNLVERLLCERRWPQAFSEAPSWTKRKERTLDTEKEALIKRYVFDEDRLSLLEPVLRVDAVRSFVKKAPKDFQRYDQLLAGLFSVCVLLSENWRQ